MRAAPHLLTPGGRWGARSACRNRLTGEKVAIKKVCPMAKTALDAKHTLREILLMRHLGRHPNVRAGPPR